MKLLTQPGDSVTSLVKAIQAAKSSIQIVIFRFDRGELERALIAAAGRGVFVHALIAYTNRGGERLLRDLEMRLLAAGVTVARTADDLVRYHGKMIIVDRKELILLGFNFTYLDMEHSRSFGVAVRNKRIVQEAIKLFEADSTRRPYSAGSPSLVVSPENARRQLVRFIRGAKKQLLIYDPQISDPAMLRLLDERSKAGVEVRVVGGVKRSRANFAVRKMVRLRLHTRTMVRDSDGVFIGSQSLRAAELDQRREIGLILRDAKLAHHLRDRFNEDWELAEPIEMKQGAPASVSKVAKKLAKKVAREVGDLAPVLEEAGADISVDPKRVEQSVKAAVKEAVKEAVEDAAEPQPRSAA